MFGTFNTVGLAIIGCGLVGRKRAASVNGAKLVYACDLDLSRAQSLTECHAGCQPVTDYHDVLADQTVQAVVVATINSELAPITLEAVRAGKHVLVEKPGALNASQLRQIQVVASSMGVVVRLGYNHRFHPALRKARTIVDSGELGPLMFLRGRYGHGGRKGYDREWRADPARSGGGELIDQGVHLIDLASWFLGDFATIEGHASTLYWDMKVDDNAFLSLRTPNGQTAWLHVSCTEWKNLFSLEIYGRHGKLAIDGLGGSYGMERLAHYKMRPEMGPPETVIDEYPNTDDSWSLETGEFLTDIVTQRTPVPGLPEAIRTLDIVEEIYRNSGYSVST